MRKQTMIAGAAFVGLLLISGGCQTDKSDMTEFFPPDEHRSIDQFCNTQAAAGARADATIQSFHFDGEKLNSLGEAKLDLMLRDDDTAEPVVVYMNLNKDDTNLKDRREAVNSYLVERGLTTDQIEFRLGTNPDATSLTANHMARVAKLESGGGSSDSGDAGGDSSGGSSSGSDGTGASSGASK